MTGKRIKRYTEFRTIFQGKQRDCMVVEVTKHYVHYDVYLKNEYDTSRETMDRDLFWTEKVQVTRTPNHPSARSLWESFRELS